MIWNPQVWVDRQMGGVGGVGGWVNVHGWFKMTKKYFWIRKHSSRPVAPTRCTSIATKCQHQWEVLNWIGLQWWPPDVTSSGSWPMRCRVLTGRGPGPGAGARGWGPCPVRFHVQKERRQGPGGGDGCTVRSKYIMGNGSPPLCTGRQTWL